MGGHPESKVHKVSPWQWLTGAYTTKDTRRTVPNCNRRVPFQFLRLLHPTVVLPLLALSLLHGPPALLVDASKDASFHPRIPGSPPFSNPVSSGSTKTGTASRLSRENPPPRQPGRVPTEVSIRLPKKSKRFHEDLNRHRRTNGRGGSFRRVGSFPRPQRHVRVRLLASGRVLESLEEANGRELQTMSYGTASHAVGFRNETRTPVTVEQYSQQFFAKVLRNGFAPEEKENSKLAAKHLFNLAKKLAAAGEREDVKVPLRVLRDEIANVYKTYPRSTRDGAVELLFQLYDGLNEELRNNHLHRNVVSEDETKQMEMIYEELRLRVYLLVTGETWQKLPQLKMIALKRLYRYMMEEIAMSRTGSGPRIVHSVSKTRQLSRKISHKIVGPDARTWEYVFADLCKASGTKLVPLIRNLLDEVDVLQMKLDSAMETIQGSGAEIASENIPDPVRISESSSPTTDGGNESSDVNLSNVLLGLSQDTSQERDEVASSQMPHGSTEFPEVFDPFPPVQDSFFTSRGHETPDQNLAANSVVPTPPNQNWYGEAHASQHRTQEDALPSGGNRQARSNRPAGTYPAQQSASAGSSMHPSYHATSHMQRGSMNPAMRQHPSQRNQIPGGGASAPKKDSYGLENLNLF